MDSSQANQPVLRHRHGSWWVEIPGNPHAFRVERWEPPHLVLSRGPDTRHFFVAPAEDGIWLGEDGYARYVPRRSRRPAAAAASSDSGHDDLSSPMPGKILEVLVDVGDKVSVGTRLLIIEAMKMENPIRATHDSVVTRIHVGVGDSVSPGDTLVELDAG